MNERPKHWSVFGPPIEELIAREERRERRAEFWTWVVCVVWLVALTVWAWWSR